LLRPPTATPTRMTTASTGACASARSSMASIRTSQRSARPGPLLAMSRLLLLAA
jgi:hypothetical protein